MKIRDVLLLSAAHNNDGMLFGEAARIATKTPNFNGTIPVSAASVAMSDRAEEIAREEGLPFGEALKKARREMADNPGDRDALVNFFKSARFDGFRFSDFDNQWVEIFRAGDYGEKGEWTPEDLDQVVSNFSTGVWIPPAVFGHPKENSPAQGWVAALKREGYGLFARFTQVSEQLESSARDGRFPNRSAAFYLDPKGSGPVLRHVGFLGATPPEVKGLTRIAFTDGGFTSIDFAG